MILAEDLERLVVRRAFLVNEIVDALLPGYQFLSLLNRRILSSDERQFFRMMLSRSPPTALQSHLRRLRRPRD